MLVSLGPIWALYVAPMFAYVSRMLAHVGPMLALCWSKFAHVDPMLA